jgi:hypothetical protein
VYLHRFKGDFRDAAAAPAKCFASIVFLTVACLTPNVAFGGLIGGKTRQPLKIRVGFKTFFYAFVLVLLALDSTGDQIGVMEMMLAAGFAGMIYAIFAGQPLVIVRQQESLSLSTIFVPPSHSIQTN